MRRLSVVLLVLALGAGGCGGSDEPPGRDNRPATSAWTRAGDFVSDPVAADGVVLVLRLRGGAVRLVALAAGSGRTLWSRPWSPGTATDRDLSTDVFRSGKGHRYAVVPVPRAEPADDGAEALAVLDLHSGKEVHRTTPLILDDSPQTCPDDTDVCVRTDTGHRVLDLDTLTLSAIDEELPGGAFWLDDEHEMFGVPGPSPALGRVVDDEVVWSTPLRRLVGERLARRFAVIGVERVGSRYWGVVRESVTSKQEKDLIAGRRLSVELGRDRTFGVGRAGGRPLWQAPGSIACVFDTPRDLDPPPFRCRQSAHADLPRGTDSLPVWTGVSTQVQGYDVKTGRTSWQVPLSTRAALRWFQGRDTLLTGTHEVALQTTKGTGLLDLKTGRLAPVSGGDVFACRAGERMVTVDPAYRTYDGTAHTQRETGRGLVPCRADGTSDGVRWTRAAVRDAATRVGRSGHVLVGPTGLRAFDLG